MSNIKRWDFEAERRRAQREERRLWATAFRMLSQRMTVRESVMKPPVFFLVVAGETVGEASNRQAADRIAACWNHCLGLPLTEREARP